MGGQLNTTTGSSITQNIAQNISFANTKYVDNGTVQATSYQARVGDPYQDWTIAHWVTPYKSDNTTYQSNPPSSEFYSGTFRFRLTSSVYIEESTQLTLDYNFISVTGVWECLQEQRQIIFMPT